jgi:SAM-dependent methyltransferase
MDVGSLVRNELVRDESGVFVLKEQRDFAYSEGAAVERYLEGALKSATDLSSSSVELESQIKDWPSEYHLTTKRAQLLQGLALPRESRVLEVGCGCGAITRHLGETFDTVVSVEGSLSRARLARLRTRGQPGVQIVCAPFQELQFAAPFDVIFCIGVYEYSGSFVSAPDPYDAVLRCFKEMLAPDGVLVVAIENQFGLKYFSSAREDHVPRMFEGIEGYHSKLAAVRTFGRTELEDNLRRHFAAVRFLYPYPDYKVPDCVLAEEFAASPAAGELISQMRSRDYGGETAPLWDESLTALELARNRVLPFFANSFLALASSTDQRVDVFPQLGVLYSPAERAPEFRTTTVLVRRADGGVVAVKRSRGKEPAARGPLKLVASESTWTASHSLHTVLYLGLKDRRASLEQVFAPCRAWLELLRAHADVTDGEYFLAGEHIDSIWQNAYPTPTGCTLIDREWVWTHPIRLPVLVVRAIYLFLFGHEGKLAAAPQLRGGGRALIRSIARTLGIELANRDFTEFVALESEFQALAYGLDRRRLEIVLRWFLLDPATLRTFAALRRRVARLARRAGALPARLARRGAQSS